MNGVKILFTTVPFFFLSLVWLIGCGDGHLQRNLDHSEHPAGDIKISFDRFNGKDYAVATVYGAPNASVDLTLIGPAVSPPANQTCVIGKDGTASLSWIVTKTGGYTVNGTYLDPGRTKKIITNCFDVR